MTSLLPPNTTKFERCLEASFERVSAVPTPARTFNDPMQAPNVVLPWLAWEKSVDVWNKNWSSDQKRKTIANSFYVHSHKGTVGALQSALDSIGFTVKVQEWFATVPRGAPYTFKLDITVDQVGVARSQYKELFAVVAITKNLRSHMVGQTLTVKSTNAVKVASALIAGNEFEFTQFVGGLYLDGSWSLDATQKINGVFQYD